MKKLIVYSYFEDDMSSVNLNFFLKNGYISDPNYQFIIMINGEKCSVKIDEKTNLKIFKRQNQGFDFGGWSDSLKKINYLEYGYFIFINSTAIGPFVPRYIPKNITWVDLFISKLDKTYKLCGPTINYLKTNKISDIPHLQSYAFSTDLEGLKLLMTSGIFNVEKNIEKRKVIINHEIKMSDIMRKNNFKIYALQLSENMNSNKVEKPHDDIHYENYYYGETLNPLEVLFLKRNRINNKIVKNYIQFNS